MKKRTAYLLTLAFLLTVCGQKPASSAASAAQDSAAENSSAAEPFDESVLVGYYEQPVADENGKYTALELQENGSGYWRLLDIDGEVADGDVRALLGMSFSGFGEPTYDYYTVTLYNERNTEAWNDILNVVGEEPEFIETGMENAVGSVAYLLLCDTPDTIVQLQTIHWEDDTMSFEVDDTVVEFYTEPGKLYQFSAIEAETIPQNQLVVIGVNGNRSTHFFQMDGRYDPDEPVYLMANDYAFG